jgi:hypothetical protein
VPVARSAAAASPQAGCGGPGLCRGCTVCRSAHTAAPAIVEAPYIIEREPFEDATEAAPTAEEHGEIARAVAELRATVRRPPDSS